MANGITAAASTSSRSMRVQASLADPGSVTCCTSAALIWLSTSLSQYRVKFLAPSHAPMTARYADAAG
jgi:hypothetical protein